MGVQIVVGESLRMSELLEGYMHRLEVVPPQLYPAIFNASIQSDSTLYDRHDEIAATLRSLGCAPSVLANPRRAPNYDQTRLYLRREAGASAEGCLSGYMATSLRPLSPATHKDELIRAMIELLGEDAPSPTGEKFPENDGTAHHRAAEGAILWEQVDTSVGHYRAAMPAPRLWVAAGKDYNLLIPPIESLYYRRILIPSEDIVWRLLERRPGVRAPHELWIDAAKPLGKKGPKDLIEAVLEAGELTLREYNGETRPQFMSGDHVVFLPDPKEVPPMIVVAAVYDSFDAARLIFGSKRL